MKSNAQYSKKNACKILIFLIFIINSSFAQTRETISVEETLKYINTKLSGLVTVADNRGELIVKFYENGNLNRTDKVPIEDLNAQAIDYLADEKAIVLKCIHKDCIDRRLVTPKLHSQFSRISISGNFDSKTQSGLIKAFEHLLLTFQDPKYKNLTPFE